jgi:hypothetical protein
MHDPTLLARLALVTFPIAQAFYQRSHGERSRKQLFKQLVGVEDSPILREDIGDPADADATFVIRHDGAWAFQTNLIHMPSGEMIHHHVPRYRYRSWVVGTFPFHPNVAMTQHGDGMTIAEFDIAFEMVHKLAKRA